MTALSETKRYQAYPEYKDSGVEWLGEIPSHWKTCRLKHLASIKNGQDYKAVQSEVGYPVMGSGGQFAFATEFMYDKPSVLLGRKGTIDKPLYINEPFWTVDTMYYTEMQPETDAKYLYYLATTIQFARYSTNTALPSMTQEHLGNYIFAVPVEVSDRTQIANFLDHETAKIDTLIERQQQLIKLLKEKRQAVISHAVTKGLNPQAPMKDSGVEWLGEVPEHWEIPKIGLACDVTKLTGFEYTNHWAVSDDGEIIALRGFNIKERFLDLLKVERISSKLSKKLSRSKLNLGDIVLPCTGTLGNACVIEADDTFHINQNIAKLSFDSRVDPHFASYWLTSEPFRRMVDFNNTSGMQPVLLIGDIRNMPLPMPPKSEQKQIVESLKNQVGTIERTIFNGESAVNLLKERRTALISAAVTGKIDVRN